MFSQLGILTFWDNHQSHSTVRYLLPPSAHWNHERNPLDSAINVEAARHSYFCNLSPQTPHVRKHGKKLAILPSERTSPPRPASCVSTAHTSREGALSAQLPERLCVTALPGERISRSTVELDNRGRKVHSREVGGLIWGKMKRVGGPGASAGVRALPPGQP